MLLMAVLPMLQVMKRNVCGHINITVTFSHCRQTNSELHESCNEKCGAVFHQALGLVPVKLDPTEFLPKENDFFSLTEVCIAEKIGECFNDDQNLCFQLEEVACHRMSLSLVVPSGQANHLACMMKEVMDMEHDSERDVMRWRPAGCRINPITVRVIGSTRNAIVIKVCYWYENELGFFLAVLNDRLPGVIVLPEDADWKDVPKRICHSLLNEVGLVLDLSKKVKKCLTVSHNIPPQTLSDIRTEFAEQQKRLEESRHVSIALEDYSRVQKQRLEQEIHTDNMVSSLMDKYYSRLK